MHIFVLLFALVFVGSRSQEVKVFNFLDYKNVSVSDSGWLYLKQNESNPLFLPEQYTICGHVFKWFDRFKYQSFGNMILLDENKNYTTELTHSIGWGGEYVFVEFKT